MTEFLALMSKAPALSKLVVLSKIANSENCGAISSVTGVLYCAALGNQGESSSLTFDGLFFQPVSSFVQSW
jgi:hypothetical protein